MAPCARMLAILKQIWVGIEADPAVLDREREALD